MTAKLTQALEMCAVTHQGMVREHNEDAISIHPELGLAILADGMGGYQAGEVASGIAIAQIGTDLTLQLPNHPPHKKEVGSTQNNAHRLLRHTVAHANLEIFQTAQAQAQCAGMGTTLAVALFYDNHVTTAHIGDSRVYRLRGEEFITLTRDHSVLQEQLDSGLISVEEARHAYYKNLVTRALGVEASVEVELNDYPVMPGDLYLLCSDGLNDMLADEDIQEALQLLGANLPLAAEQLIQMANDAGGKDNVSVILIRAKDNFSQKSRLSWLLPWL